MQGELSSGQQIFLDEWVGEKVTVELVNREKYEDVLIKEIDPYSMTFIFKFPDYEEAIQIKRIFKLRKYNEDFVPEKLPSTYKKRYNSKIGAIE